jgi:hypothetical protein
VKPLDSFPAFYGTRRFITAFTRALHLSLSWTRPIQSTTPHPISPRSILHYLVYLSHLGKKRRVSSYHRSAVSVDYFASAYTRPGAHSSVMVNALCYKPEGRGFETQWGKWILSIYLILPAALCPGVQSASNRGKKMFLENRARPIRRANSLTAMCELYFLNSWM